MLHAKIISPRMTQNQFLTPVNYMLLLLEESVNIYRVHRVVTQLL